MGEITDRFFRSLERSEAKEFQRLPLKAYEPERFTTTGGLPTLSAPLERNLLEKIRDYWINLTPDEKLMEVVGLAPVGPAKVAPIAAKAMAGAIAAVPLAGILKPMAVSKTVVPFLKTLAKFSGLPPNSLRRIEEEAIKRRLAKYLPNLLSVPQKELSRINNISYENLPSGIMGIYRQAGHSPDTPLIQFAKGIVPDPRTLWHELAHARTFSPGMVPGEWTAARKVLDLRSKIYEAGYSGKVKSPRWDDPIETLARQVGRSMPTLAPLQRPRQHEAIYMDALLTAIEKAEELLK